MLHNSQGCAKNPPPYEWIQPSVFPFSEEPLQDTHPLQVPLITVWVTENASKVQETSSSPLSVGGQYAPTINFLSVGGSKRLIY